MKWECYLDHLSNFLTCWKEISKNDFDLIFNIIEYVCDNYKEDIGKENNCFDCIKKLFLLLRNLSTFELQRNYITFNYIEKLIDMNFIEYKELEKFRFQFLSNYITNNEDNKNIIWNKVFPTIIEESFNMFNNTDDCYHVLLVFTYNIIINDIDKINSIISNNNILNHILSNLDTQNDKILEWIVLFFRLFLKNKKLEQMYNCCSIDNDITELNLCILRLINEEIYYFKKSQQITDITNSIPIDSCYFLVACFTNSFRKVENCENESNYHQVVFILLEIFGELSNEAHKTNYLQDAFYKSNLVLICIELLGKLSKDNVNESLKGLKVNLVRILGNLSYKHYPTQEQIRESHGLELILNQCKIDPSNEYIKEWSILSIRNLCDNNIKNQEFINNLKAQQVVEVPTEMTSAGIKCDIKDGKVTFKAPPK